MVEEVQLKKTLCYGALNEDVLIIDLTVKEFQLLGLKN